MGDVKITKLSALNIAAMRECLPDRYARQVAYGATIITFRDMTPEQAAEAVTDTMNVARLRAGSKGHPYQSLHTVQRRIKSLTD